MWQTAYPIPPVRTRTPRETTSNRNGGVTEELALHVLRSGVVLIGLLQAFYQTQLTSTLKKTAFPEDFPQLPDRHVAIVSTELIRVGRRLFFRGVQRWFNRGHGSLKPRDQRRTVSSSVHSELFELNPHLSHRHGGCLHGETQSFLVGILDNGRGVLVVGELFGVALIVALIVVAVFGVVKEAVGAALVVVGGGGAVWFFELEDAAQAFDEFLFVSPHGNVALAEFPAEFVTREMGKVDSTAAHHGQEGRQESRAVVHVVVVVVDGHVVVAAVVSVFGVAGFLVHLFGSVGGGGGGGLETHFGRRRSWNHRQELGVACRRGVGGCGH